MSARPPQAPPSKHQDPLASLLCLMRLRCQSPCHCRYAIITFIKPRQLVPRTAALSFPASKHAPTPTCLAPHRLHVLLAQVHTLLEPLHSLLERLHSLVKFTLWWNPFTPGEVTPLGESHSPERPPKI